MLVTISTTHRPARDLGYLLHKHPDKLQSFTLSHGTAHVFYPHADEERCTCALLYEIDPITLVRGKAGTPTSGRLRDYVNDRPYAASSMTAIALGEVFRSAINARCAARESLVTTPIPLEVSVAAVRTGCGRERIKRLWTVLGYGVELEEGSATNDASESYAVLRLASTDHTLAEVLRHLYVLIPAIDGARHHYVSETDVEVLVRRGEGWLGEHPDREWIGRRYMNRQRSLAELALAQLAPEVESTERDESDEAPARPARVSLARTRIDTVRDRLIEHGATQVVDVGCGEGSLVRALAAEPAINAVLGVDVSAVALERAERKLRRTSERVSEKITLALAPAGVEDARWATHDAIALVEVIEHIDPERWEPVERCVFEAAAPATVIVTTPNREYNALYGLEPHERRHRDHRFEWDRAGMRAWCERTARRYGYEVRIEGIGPADPEHGSPTMMGVFTR